MRENKKAGLFQGIQYLSGGFQKRQGKRRVGNYPGNYVISQNWKAWVCRLQRPNVHSEK